MNHGKSILWNHIAQTPSTSQICHACMYITNTLHAHSNTHALPLQRQEKSGQIACHKVFLFVRDKLATRLTPVSRRNYWCEWSIIHSINNKNPRIHGWGPVLGYRVMFEMHNSVRHDHTFVERISLLVSYAIGVRSHKHYSSIIAPHAPSVDNLQG